MRALLLIPLLLLTSASAIPWPWPMPVEVHTLGGNFVVEGGLTIDPTYQPTVGPFPPAVVTPPPAAVVPMPGPDGTYQVALLYHLSTLHMRLVRWGRGYVVWSNLVEVTP